MSYDLLDTDSGNAVYVALDHGLASGAIDGFEDPTAVLDDVLAADPDGLLVGPHFARRYRDRLADTNLVVTGDVVTFSTRPGEDEAADVWTDAFDVDLLLDLDPVGVKVVLVFGREDRAVFRRNIEAVARLAEELRGTGVPLVVEPVMWGSRVPSAAETDPDLVANALRMGWEYGADVLKAPYTGDEARFGEVVSNAPVPVMMLGGPKTGGTRGTLEAVSEAMDAGARGLMMGRSVWQSDDVTRTVEALNRIVHDGASVAAVWD
ncbi:class I fructose-bisphosphate aldolase [Halarchaeum grantii]|uniref:class I fructose-bisphosphate aldolase n=1 Tax=Halarchaeum grantii TaxID=1193105 RepID=UPI00166C8233|nr:fructose-1,6-bisphosphate aldolase [Halarchaeum grantii]